jgi:hypothetical protein
MALYYELQVFKDVYTLVQKVFLYTQEFPREYKYTFGQDMKRDAIQLVSIDYLSGGICKFVIKRIIA